MNDTTEKIMGMTSEEEAEVYEGEMGNYRVLEAFPYTDEEGKEAGMMEVGSVHSMPVILGKGLIEDGLVEEVLDEKIEEDTVETPAVEVDPMYLAKKYMGQDINGSIQDIVLRGNKYVKFQAGVSRAEYIVTVDDFIKNSSNE